jgi:hypothetical protein
MSDRCWEHGTGECLGCIEMLQARNKRLVELLQGVLDALWGSDQRDWPEMDEAQEYLKNHYEPTIAMMD